MPTIAEFKRCVDDMERGETSNSAEGRNSAIKRLIDAICTEPWRDGDERSAAQVLVYRLSKLKRVEGAASATAEAAAPVPARKRAGAAGARPGRSPARAAAPLTAAIAGRAGRGQDVPGPPGSSIVSSSLGGP